MYALLGARATPGTTGSSARTDRPVRTRSRTARLVVRAPRKPRLDPINVDRASAVSGRFRVAQESVRLSAARSLLSLSLSLSLSLFFSAASCRFFPKKTGNLYICFILKNTIKINTYNKCVKIKPNYVKYSRILCLMNWTLSWIYIQLFTR